MELLIIVIALCAMGLIAIRFGQDSREQLHASEGDDRRDMTWQALF
jgi:hypothetical protein